MATTGTTTRTPVSHLRVLIANERLDRLAVLAKVVTGMGHTVVERSIQVGEVAQATAELRPDVALVGLGASAEHALRMVSEIVSESYCPVIAILGSNNAPWVREAAERGAFAYLVDDNPAALQSAIEIALVRFAEAESLKASITRRILESQRESTVHSERLRTALELHDGVVQTLAVAKLAQDLGRDEEARAAVEKALELAKEGVSKSLADLRDSGLSTHQLIRDSAALTPHLV